ncbi:MAG: hypothetical protein IKM27_06490 [Clostridia bacterium]|nr:hypothetical protein [Clostridia bacterium]
MKKIFIILLCIVFILSAFASCDQAEESKTETSESVSETVSEALPEKNEEESKVETPASWGAEYDWDFLKGWPTHSDHIHNKYGNTQVYLHYESNFLAAKGDHDQFEILVHFMVYAYYLKPGETPPLDPNYVAKRKACDEEEFARWLEAGDVPLELKTITVEKPDGTKTANAFCGYISFNDVEKLIEYAIEAGYFLRISFIEPGYLEKDNHTFDCPLCNGNCKCIY